MRANQLMIVLAGFLSNSKVDSKVNLNAKFPNKARPFSKLANGFCRNPF